MADVELLILFIESIKISFTTECPRSRPINNRGNFCYGIRLWISNMGGLSRIMAGTYDIVRVQVKVQMIINVY